MSSVAMAGKLDVDDLLILRSLGRNWESYHLKLHAHFGGQAEADEGQIPKQLWPVYIKKMDALLWRLEEGDSRIVLTGGAITAARSAPGRVTLEDLVKRVVQFWPRWIGEVIARLLLACEDRQWWRGLLLGLRLRQLQDEGALSRREDRRLRR